MRALFLLIPIVGTAIALTACVEFPKEEVLGLALVGYGDTPGWITMGGVGVLCLGVGAGVVEIGAYGFGVLFGTGQLAGSLGIGIGQAGFGGTLFVGQVGGALTGVAQMFFGFLGMGQVAISWDGTEFLEKLQADLADSTMFTFPTK